MWADGGPQDPQGHSTGTPHRFPLHSLFPSPCSPEFAVQLLQVAPPPHTEGPEHPQVICPRPAGSSPGSDLTSASVLSGVDGIVSPLLRELRAQDSPHTRVEEGRPPPGLNAAATCQIGSDPRGLRAKP